MPLFRTTLGAIALAITALPAISAHAAGSYQLTRLASPGYAAFAPQSINESGVIAGVLQPDPADPYRLVAGYYRDGGLTQITPVGADGMAFSVNNHGDVAGSYTPQGSYDQKAFAVVNGQFQTLPVPHDHATARGINDAGQVVGTGVFEEPWSEQSAFIYQNGQLTQLGRDVGLENGDYYSLSADGINEAGQVIVNANGVDRHSYVWQNGGYTRIAAPERHGQVLSRSINDQGQVVGQLVWYDSPTGYLDQAFVYDSVKGLQILPTGGTGSEAVGINNQGDIIGHLIHDKATMDQAPFLYHDGQLTLLQDLVGPGDVRLLQVSGINDLGQIVGLGLGAEGLVGVLLTPTAVPEPGSAWLALVGMAGVFVMRARGRRAARNPIPGPTSEIAYN